MATRGSSDGQLNNPYGLAVNKRGYMDIADQSNNKVHVLDPNTLTAKQITLEGGLNTPCCVHLDQKRARLYIGEWGGAQLIALGRRQPAKWATIEAYYCPICF